MTNYVIKLRSGRLCNMCVYLYERKREREEATLMNNETRWGVINYIKKHHQFTKIPTMRYMCSYSYARVHMYEENIGTKV